MKIVATSDLHGNLPRVPSCDVLVIAGDISPVWGPHKPNEQAHWFEHKFAKWVSKLNAARILLVAGNHDFFPQVERGVQAIKLLEELDERFSYLEDLGTEVDGKSFYGTPWTLNLPGWAFQADDYDGESLPPRVVLKNGSSIKLPSPPKASGIFSKIPEKLNVLISHGPPEGYGDKTSTSHAGSYQLLKAVIEKRPKIVICGHIHEGYGHYRCGDKTDIYCVSHLNRQYHPVNQLIEIEI